MTKNYYLHWITFVAINGGLLFGLNMAGISGANDMITGEFGLRESELGMVASFLMIGCLIGALFAGGVAEKIGRKKAMIIIAALFTISGVGCATASGFVMLTLFRVLSGIAVGASSVVCPMYISEISPANKRGTLVTFYQFAVTVGILLAYVFDYFLLNLGADSWRYMLGVPAVFGLMYMIYLMVSFCESPRWLLSRGRKKEALSVMKKIGDDVFTSEDLAEMKNSLTAEKSKDMVSIGEIFKGKTGKVVFMGTLVAAFQQITGINAVIVFAPDILKSAGVGGDTALFQSMIVGLVNVLMTIIALRFVDTKGRKTLLLWGSAGMLASLAYLSFAFSGDGGNSTAILIAILAYISFFAASFAAVMWVMISEIYPARIKGLAMSFSTAVSWGCSFLVVYFAPIIRYAMGDSALFAIFGVFALMAFLYVKIYVPETKGKTLEQIESELKL